MYLSMQTQMMLLMVRLICHPNSGIYSHRAVWTWGTFALLNGNMVFGIYHASTSAIASWVYAVRWCYQPCANINRKHFCKHCVKNILRIVTSLWLPLYCLAPAIRVVLMATITTALSTPEFLNSVVIHLISITLLQQNNTMLFTHTLDS